MSFFWGVKRGEITWCKGSVLIEVMVAVVILGVFLGGLAGTFQRSYGAAVRLRTDAATLPTSLLRGRLAEAWSWGPMIDVAEWNPGPVLRVVPGVGCDSVVEVGIWADGWLLGEYPVDVPGVLEVSASTWQGLIGSEVTIRARKSQGYWGAPWRTVVPDGYGYVENTALGITIYSESPTSFDEAFAVMHLHSLAGSGIETSWMNGVLTELVADLVIALGETGSGVCTVRSDGRSQSWVGSEDRRFDLFW